MLWLAMSLAFVAALAGPACAERVRVRVKLDGPLRGEHAIFFVARDKGYLQAEGVEMVIEEGGPALNTLLIVSQSKFEFGFADLPSLVLARAAGVTVRALAVVSQKSPWSLVALKGTALATPRDLEGKVVGVDPGTPSFIFYRALLAAHRVDRAKITEVPMTRPYPAMLLTRKIQVMPAEIGGEIPELEGAVGAQGLEILRGTDWGYDVLGGGLFTSLRLLKAAPDVARRFTRAYLRAFRDVIDQPREAVAILVRSHPALAERADLLLRQLEAGIRSTFTSEDTKAHGLGWNPPERWQHTHDTLLRAGIIAKPINPVTSLYTNEFLGP